MPQLSTADLTPPIGKERIGDGGGGDTMPKFSGEKRMRRGEGDSIGGNELKRMAEATGGDGRGEGESMGPFMGVRSPFSLLIVEGTRPSSANANPNAVLGS